MDDPPLDRPIPSRGVHPLAGLPPLLATLAVASDPIGAQLALITGSAGVVVAEVISRRLHRSRERAHRAGARAGLARFLAVPAVTLLCAGIAYLASRVAVPVAAPGLRVGAIALVASALLLLLPLRATPLAGWWSQLLGRPVRAAGARSRQRSGGRAPLVPGARQYRHR